MPIKFIKLIFVIFILCSCSTEKQISRPAPVIKTVRYADGNVCQEKRGPPIFQLGIECICDKNHSPIPPVSISSSKPGYTSECKSPEIWAQERQEINQAEQRRLADEAERKRQIQLKIKRDQEFIEKFKVSKEGIKAKNVCLEHRKRLDQVEYSCASAFDKKSCINTRFKGVTMQTVSECRLLDVWLINPFQ